jgi:hypothetical protein
MIYLCDLSAICGEGVSARNFSATFCVNKSGDKKRSVVAAFFLWCILFLICWPLALLALILYPLVWLFLLPFRLVGIAVEGALKLVWAVVTLPARLLVAPFRV